MEDLTIAEKFKNAARRFSRKGSYECTFNAPTFKLKAVCLHGIRVKSSDPSVTREAVDTALSSVGSLEGKNKPDVLMTISLREGVNIVPKRNKKDSFNYRIHEIGYCNVDKRYQQIFVFIAGKDILSLKCHIFLCEDVQKSRAICLTMAKAFDNAYSNLKKSNHLSSNYNKTINRLIDRRRSADVITKPSLAQLEKRRASDFTACSNRLDIRRSSADAICNDDDMEQSPPNSSDDESIGYEKERRFNEISLLQSDNNNKSLLRRGSTDWDAIERDEEVMRKMQGDLILWE